MQHSPARSGRKPRPTLTVIFVALAVIATGCAGNTVHLRSKEAASAGARVVTGATDAASADAGAPAPTSDSAAAAPDATGAAAPAADAGGSGAPAATGATTLAAATSGAHPSGAASGVAAPRGAAAAAGGPGAVGNQSNPSGSAAGGGSARPGANPGQSGAAPGGPGAPAPTPGVPSGPGTTIGVTKDTVTVGVFYAKTGFYAGLLRNTQAVMQAAFDEAGPINGRRLLLKAYDDGSYNTSTIQVEEKRAKDESFGLVSLVSESNTILAPLVDQHKVPTIVANIDQRVALQSHHVFPLTAYWARQATILPEFIKNQLGAGSKRIGIVYEGTSTAKDAKDAFKAKAATLGEQIVFEQPIATDQTTCANEVSNLQANRVEVVFLMNGPLGAICMIRDARALGYKPIWTGVGTSWNFNATATATGGGTDGIRMLTSSTTLETPPGRHYTELMHQKAPNSGAEDDDIELLYYGLAQGFIEGLRRTGPNLTREAFEQTFETKMNGYDSGYFPPPTFGPGDRTGVTSVGATRCCQNGKWVMDQPGWHSGFPAKPASRPPFAPLRPYALTPQRTPFEI